MSPFARQSSTVNDDSSRRASASARESQILVHSASSYDSPPTASDHLIDKNNPTFKLSPYESLSWQNRNSDAGIRSSANSGSSSGSSRPRDIGREWTRESDSDSRWDWEGDIDIEVKGEGEGKVKDEQSQELGDSLEDMTYRNQRRRGREGKMNRLGDCSTVNDPGASPMQRILTDRKRTGRRRSRDTDDAARINQVDLASLSSPVNPNTATLLSISPPPPPSLTHIPASPLPTTHSHLSSNAPIISPDPAHDAALTSAATASRTTLLPSSTSSTSSNTVGIIHHVASPIPVIAGTLVGIIALLVAIVVAIVVTRRKDRSRTPVRSRRSWLQHHASIVVAERGGDGDGDGSVGVGAGVVRVRSRSAGSARPGGGRARAQPRDRDKTRKRRARATSSSNETVSTDSDPQEIRSGPGIGPAGGQTGSAFGGAVDFGARGSVARCFDIPVHRDSTTARSSSGKVRKKKHPSDAMVMEDVSKLPQDVERGYDPHQDDLNPHALDSPYTELHIRQPKSTSQQSPSSAAYQYPPPVGAYGTVSSTLLSPSLSPARARSSIQGDQNRDHYQPQSPSHLAPYRDDHSHRAYHTSPSVSARPGHLMGQSPSPGSSSSAPPPPPRTQPPPLHRPRSEPTVPSVKRPSGPPDTTVTTHSDDLEDLPPAYDPM